MRRMKGMAVPMTALLLASAVAGCSGGEAPLGEGTSKTGKRIKISMMYPLYGDPPQKTEAWKHIEEKFNIEFEPIAVPNNSYNDKLKVTLASGDMPDLILWTNYPDPELVKYVNQGAFLELDQLIKASPHIMKTPQGIFDNVKVEGKLYSVPRTRALNRSAVMIRKDWLDNLGMPVPKTVDELYKTAVAFTTNDPDKNGKSDTFGIALGENLSHLDALFMAFDMGSGWRKMEDGSLMSDAITPGRKQALEWLRKLYAEGGLDKDFAVLKNTQVWEKLEGGKAGILIGGQTSDYARYVDNLTKIDPKANLIMIAPPTGPTGKSGYGETSGFFGQWVIPAKTDKEKAARLMQFLDWQAGDEAYKLKRYGVEGVHHSLENGKPKLNADKYKADGVDSLIPHNPYDPYSYVVLTAPEAVQKAQKENLDFVANLGVKNPALSFVAPTAIEKQSDLTKLRDETYVKIVMGKAPLEDFDKFVKEWLDKGGAQITKETNEWFKKQK